MRGCSLISYNKADRAFLNLASIDGQRPGKTDVKVFVKENTLSYLKSNTPGVIFINNEQSI
jgi:hypothetical protein